MNTSISEQRLAANRANAQKSTGPKTLEGRAASRMNALKHGLLSQEVLICSPHRYESEEELFALHDRFRDELQPTGPLELMLCDQIVTTHWRLRRVLAAESAEMSLCLRRGRSPSSRQPDFQPEEEVLLWDESAAGCREAQRLLGNFAQTVRRKGALTADILNVEGGFFGAQLNIRADLEDLLERRGEKPEGLEAKAWKEQHLTEVLDYLDNRIREMKVLEEEHYAAGLMPEVEVLDRFGRYESMLNRQLNRGVTQLAKLQKERRKEEKAALSSDEDLWGMPKIPGAPRSPQSKPTSDPLEQAHEILRNKARALDAPVQGSEFKVQSSSDLPNEATEASAASEISDLRSQMSGQLPNEPIPSAQPSEISHLSSEIDGNLPNEAMADAGIKEPQMKHGQEITKRSQGGRS
jgi:hypothetical protein